MVDNLKETLGATWAQASVPRAKRHSKLVKSPLSQPPSPWVEPSGLCASAGTAQLSACPYMRARMLLPLHHPSSLVLHAELELLSITE